MQREQSQTHADQDMTKSRIDELARRDVLKSMVAGAVGVGLVCAGETPTMAQPGNTACPQILRVSKGVTARIGRWQCERCKCKEQRNFLISFAFRGPLMSNKRCDETAKQIPDKTELAGSLRLKLRAGKCPETDADVLWGCQDGTFRLIGMGVPRVMSGTMTGTSGFNPGPDPKTRCCDPYARGMMKGKGIEPLTGCELCASYFLKIPYRDFTDPCKAPPAELILMIDGVLICPCPQ